MDAHVLVLLATFVALFVSSIAGYGGSLILVPALGALLGIKEGVALAALLLGWNNVFKVVAYRHTLALRRGWPLLVVTAIGVWFGATLLIAAPDEVVIWAVVAVTVLSLGAELLRVDRVQEAQECWRRAVLAVPTSCSPSPASSRRST